MKRISIAIFTIMVSVSNLSASNVADNYLYQTDKSVEMYLLSIKNESSNHLQNFIFNQLTNIKKKILAQINKSQHAQNQLSALPLKQNIPLFMQLATQASAYYQNPCIAEQLSFDLENNMELILIHLYTYALIHYEDPIQRIYFYRAISDANNALTQALMDHQEEFLEAISVALKYWVKITPAEHEQLAHAHGLYH